MLYHNLGIIQEYFQPKIGRKIGIFSLGRKSNIFIKKRVQMVLQKESFICRGKRLGSGLLHGFIKCFFVAMHWLDWKRSSDGLACQSGRNTCSEGEGPINFIMVIMQWTLAIRVSGVRCHGNYQRCLLKKSAMRWRGRELFRH